MTALTEAPLDTRVGRVQVWRGGSGRTVVHLHTAQGEGPGSPFLEALAEHHDVVAPMFPGFGDSEGIGDIDDIEDAAFHLLDVLDRLGLEAAAVVGASLGGWLAAELATRWPERVSSLVLVGPAGLWIEGAPIVEIFGRDPGELAEDLFADQSHPMAQLMHQIAALGQDRLADVPFEMLRPTLQALQATAKIAWNPYLHNPKLAGRLHRITAPTLVVRGAQDRLVPRAHAEAYVTAVASARLEEIAGAGHLVTLERPGEVAALVRAHLS